MRFHSTLFLGVLLISLAGPSRALPSSTDWRPVLAPSAPQYNLEYWLKRVSNREKVRLSAYEITVRNQQLMQTEKTMVHWPNWSSSLSADEVRARVNSVSKITLSDAWLSTSQPLRTTDIQRWRDNMAMERIEASTNQNFGLIVRRTAVRRLPTPQGVFDAAGGPDIDRLQESALFPGTPVAVLHQSRDQLWTFIQADNYAGWIHTLNIALAHRDEVMAYAEKKPRRWITGHQVRTAFVPGSSELSEQVLDMGSSFPARIDWPVAQLVNGQASLASWVIDFPTRDDSGKLRVVPVLIPRSADTQSAPLPANASQVLRQSFKFLGERYGWGHDYNARDCSGFVSEVYAALGIRMPRNTGDQQRSLNFNRLVFASEWSSKQRMAKIDALKVGDLIYIPGHVMLVLGHDQYGPWVIHDVQKSSMPLAGKMQSLALNGVSVTPIRALHLSDGRSYIDAITAVQRILP